MRDRKGTSKNFFYRVNPNEVLAELVFVENREQWLLQFLDDLRNDDPSKARSDIARQIIIEAHLFRKKRSIAGKASAQRKSNSNSEKLNDHHMLNICPTSVQQSSTSSSSSSSSNKSKPLPAKTPPAGYKYFRDWWVYSFSRLEEDTYIFESGKDGSCLSQMLKCSDLKGLICRACRYLTDKDRFPKGRPTLSGLKGSINKYPGFLEQRDADRFRALGILPPDGENLEDWQPWKENSPSI